MDAPWLGKVRGFAHCIRAIALLRQPGYGSCYITGKLLVDRLIMEYGEQQDRASNPFVLRDFLDRFNNEGMIPVLLMESDMVSHQQRGAPRASTSLAARSGACFVSLELILS